MPNRKFGAGVTGAAALLLCLPAPAWADPSTTPDPAPPPPLPDVNAYPPISPVPYAVSDGTMYVFAGPGGVQCGINRQTGGYGCSGPLPGAPDGANLVSGGPVGPPSFGVNAPPMFGTGGAKPLPPNTRVSFREISCGIDGAGVLACVNSRDQVGFVVSPTATFINDVMPLVARPEGSNPFLPGLPG